MSRSEDMRPPLLLTGGPAAGKSATALRLGASLRRAAVIDVDDLRQLVIAGHAAPWEGAEDVCSSASASRMPATSTAAIFAGASTWSCPTSSISETAALYHHRLPGILIVQLRLPLAEARRRATLRPTFLTEDESMPSTPSRTPM